MKKTLWGYSFLRQVWLLLFAVGIATAAAAPFIIVVNTEYRGISSANQFNLPLFAGANYNFSVDWGDGTSSVITTSNSPTHTYAVAGTYTIKISENVIGGFPRIYFNGPVILPDFFVSPPPITGDYNKLIDISQWGGCNWTSMAKAFSGCQNLLTISAADWVTAQTGNVTDFTLAWANCTKLTSFPLLNTSAGTTFFGTWLYCRGLTSFPLLNTSAGTTFEYAWSNCLNLTSFPLLNTAAGTNFQYAWWQCYGLTSFPLLNTAAGTNFQSAWEQCTLSNFPSLNLGQMNNGSDCFADVPLSVDSYSNLLISLASLNAQMNVEFDGGLGQFNLSAASARNTLTNARGWLITDGGPASLVPTVTTTTISGVTFSAAVGGGNVNYVGESAVTARGVCWSTSANPTIVNNKTTNGTGVGSFISAITGLSAGATYHVRAYATNSGGTAYGANVTFTTTANTPPTVATDANVNPKPVTGTTTTLSVLGSDDAGEVNLTYTWATTGTPPASVTYNRNGNNAAKSVTATFTKPGSYTFRATIRDGSGLSVSSDVTVVVNQTTSVTVNPDNVRVNPSAQQTFAASARDQFNMVMSAQPPFNWTTTGGGSITAAGVFTAGTVTGGPHTITATGGGKSGTSTVYINGAPTLATNGAAIASPNPVTTKTTTLTALGADDNGEANLTYTWTTTGNPPGTVTYSVNGTNAAKSTTATFPIVGPYTFRVTITDQQGRTVTSDVVVVVNATSTSLAVTPTSATTTQGNIATFNAITNNQFGSPYLADPTTWSVNGGGTMLPSDSIILEASGADIFGTSDGGHFMSQSLTGDGSIIARVDHLQNAHPWAKAGLMIRDGLTANAINAMVEVTPASGVLFQRRTTVGGASTNIIVTGIVAPRWLRLTRVGQVLTGFHSADGSTWVQVGSDTVTMGATVRIGLALTSHVVGARARAVFSKIAVTGGSTTPGALLSGWIAQDIGTTAVAGSVTYTPATGLFTTQSIGTDIFGTADGFHFVHQPLTGDGTIIARVVSQNSTTAWAKAGVMMRDSLTADAKKALVVLTPSAGALFQYRTTAADVSVNRILQGVAAPNWVKLVRAGSFFTGYVSTDGVKWTVIGSQTVTMGSTVYVGLASCLRMPTLATAMYSNVQVFGGATAAVTPQSPWSAQDLGTVALAGSSRWLIQEGTFLSGTTVGGPWTVTATSGSLTKTATVSVTNAVPTIGVAAKAAPATVTGKTTNLSAWGADDAGENNLIYTWSSTNTPSPTFSVNGTNAAKNTTATFSKIGTYTLQVRASDAQNASATSSVTVTVNATSTGVAVSPASASIAKNATQLFTATATDQFGGALATQPTFTWTKSGGGTISATGLFTAGATVGGPFTITATGGGKSGTASVTIIDQPSIAFSSATSSIGEGDVQLDIPVQLSWPHNQTVTVAYSVTGTAIGNGNDYYLPNGTLTFLAGETKKDLALLLQDDASVEGNETVIVALSTPVNGFLGATNVHTSTIVDNDKITVQVVATDPVVNEDGTHYGSLTFTRNGSLAAALTASVNFTGSTATIGTDFTDPTDTGMKIIFPIGVASVSRVITPIQDVLHELDETIVVSVVAGSGYAVGTQNSATLTIHDDDVITIAATAATAAEATTPINGQFTISRVGTTGPLSVALAFSGKATLNSDYTRTPSGTTVIIPAGQSSVSVTITPVQDTNVEGPETVIATIIPTTPVGTYTIGTLSSATVTINDDDAPTVSIVATDAIAAEPTGDNAVFTIKRAVATAAALTVTYQVTGTATPGLDYTTLSGSAIIAANADTTTVTLAALGDQIIESDETVILTLVSGSKYNVASAASAVATIKDCAISIAATKSQAFEPGGDPATYDTFTISRSYAATVAQTVQVAWSGSATPTIDFTTAPSTTTTVTIPANATSTSVTLMPKADALVEGTESAVLSFAPAVDYATGINSAASVTLVDATLTISVDRSELTEFLNQRATVTVTRTGYTSLGLTVPFTVSGTATAGVDYVRGNNNTSILLASTISSATAIFTTSPNDTLVEGDETIIATIGPSSYGIINSSTIITIHDDDLAEVNLAVSDADAGEAGANPGAFTLSRTGATTNPLVVTLTRSGTATAVGDYTASPTSITGSGTITVTIPAGQALIPITITPVDDSTAEVGETVILTMVPNPSYQVGQGQAQISISDNEAPVVIVSATTAQATEDGAVGVVTIKRLGSLINAITVGFTTTGSSATAGSDYKTLISPVMLEANVASKDISIEPLDDTTAENNETVKVNLATGIGYSLGATTSATVTIADNDRPTVKVAALQANAAEGAVPVTGMVRFTRIGDTSATLSVPFILSGSASTVPGTDYTLSPSGSAVNFAVNVSTADLTITPVNNAVASGDKTVVVSLGSGAFNQGSENSAIIIIGDDERPTVSMVATKDTATEAGLTSATVTVTRSASSANALTIPYAISGSATAGIDYLALSGSIVIPANAKSAVITLVPKDDTEIEQIEFVMLTLNAGSGYNLGTTGASIQILSDDLPTPIVQYQKSGVGLSQLVGGIPSGFDIVRVVASTTMSGISTNVISSFDNFTIDVGTTLALTVVPVSLRFETSGGQPGPLIQYPVQFTTGGIREIGDPDSAPIPAPRVTIAVNSASLTGVKTETVDGVEWNFSNKNSIIFDVNVSSVLGTVESVYVATNNGEIYTRTGSGTIEIPIAKDGRYTFTAGGTVGRGSRHASAVSSAPVRVCVERYQPKLSFFIPKKYWANMNKPELFSGVNFNGSPEDGVFGNAFKRKYRGDNFYNLAAFSPTGATGDNALSAQASNVSGLRKAPYQKFNNGYTAFEYGLAITGESMWPEGQKLELTKFEQLPNGSWSIVANLEDRCGNKHAMYLGGGIVERYYPYNPTPSTWINNVYSSPVRFQLSDVFYSNDYVYQGTPGEDNLIQFSRLPNATTLPSPTYSANGDITFAEPTEIPYLHESGYGNYSSVYNFKVRLYPASTAHKSTEWPAYYSQYNHLLGNRHDYFSFRDPGATGGVSDITTHGYPLGSSTQVAFSATGGFVKFFPNSETPFQSSGSPTDFVEPSASVITDISDLRSVAYIRPIDPGAEGKLRKFQPVAMNIVPTWSTKRPEQKFRIRDNAISTIKMTFGGVAAQVYDQENVGYGYHYLDADPNDSNAVISSLGNGFVADRTQVVDGFNTLLYHLQKPDYGELVSNDTSGWFMGVSCVVGGVISNEEEEWGAVTVNSYNESERAFIGSYVNLVIGGGFFDKSFKLSDFQANNKDYFKFIRASDGKECTASLLEGDSVPLSGFNLRDKIVTVSQKSLGYSHIKVKVKIGEDVEPGIYHLDIKCGRVHAYPDELSAAYAGSNGAHRLTNAFRVINLQFVRPVVASADATPAMTSTIPLSVPTPGIQLNTIPAAVIDSNNQVSLKLSGVLRDPIADCEQGPSDVYKSMSLSVDGTPAGQIGITEAADGAAGLWKPFPRKGTFSQSVRFAAKEGIHSLKLTTAKNAAGLSASTTLLISVQVRTVPIPGTPGSGEIAGKMALSVERIDSQRLRMWWGTGVPPADAVILTVDPTDAKKFNGTSGPVSFQINATWPVANAAVKSNFPLDLTTSWAGSVQVQGRLTWQMSETSLTSERFVGFQDVVIPASPGENNPGLQTWTASVSGGAGVAPGAWTPLAVRVKGINLADPDRITAFATRWNTIERDGWLYAAWEGRPILYGATAADSGGIAGRLSYGSSVWPWVFTSNLEQEASLDSTNKVKIGANGWEEWDLMAGGSPRPGRFAHVTVVTPSIRIDHQSLSIQSDGKLHIEGDVFDPLEAVSGTEAMMVVVNDTVADIDPILPRDNPTLSGGGRRKFRATVPLPKSKMLIWTVATNAAGGQAFDRLMVDDGAFTTDWPGSRSWSRVSRYRFGATAPNKVLMQSDWKTFIQSGEDKTTKQQVDVELASDLAVVTKPVVVTRVNDQLADRELLKTLVGKTGKVVLTVNDLDTDLYVVVEAPANQRTLWQPDLNYWEVTKEGWRRRIQQAGLEVIPTSMPVAMRGNAQDTADLNFTAKARNLSPGDVSVRVSSVDTLVSFDQVVGTIAEPAANATLPAAKQPAVDLATTKVPLRLGVNQIGLDIARDSDGQAIATTADLGVYVMDPEIPYTRITVLDARIAGGSQNDAPQNPPALLPPKSSTEVASGRIFFAVLKSGLSVTDAGFNKFMRENKFEIVGTSDLSDESGASQLIAWIQFTGMEAVAYGTILDKGAAFFVDIGGNEGPSALMTKAALKMKALLDSSNAFTRMMSRTPHQQYHQLKRDLDLEITVSQTETVQKTLGSATPAFDVLDCRYTNKTTNEDVFKGSSRWDFVNTRMPFNDAYQNELSQSNRNDAPYRLSHYQFLGYDNKVKKRNENALNSKDSSIYYSPRVFLSSPTSQTIANIAQRAVASGGVMIAIHGFNNGQGEDGDDNLGVHVNVDEELHRHRIFANYWPVLETLLRDQGVVRAQSPIIHVWWSGSVDRSKWILNIPSPWTAYPAGVFFNMDVAAGHFTGYYKVAPFIRLLSASIQQQAGGATIPITLLAESLGNRVAVSAMDALNEGISAGAVYKEKGKTPLRYLALHPAMRTIDLTPSWMTDLSEEKQREINSTPIIHRYPESPIMSEMSILASADPLQCRTFMAYSSYDKAGIAFLSAQMDDPRSDPRDNSKQAQMLGRRGVELAGENKDADGKPTVRYKRDAGRANIAAYQIGLNDGSAGAEGTRDYWHVDLWGWALPGQPYRSRNLYGNNLPQSSFTGYEGKPGTKLLWVLPSDIIAPGLEAAAAIDVPFWNQIALPEALIDRAWRLPKQLVRDGFIPPPSP